MDKSDIIKDIKRKTKDFLFFQDVKIKDIKFTDGIGNGQVIINKDGIDFVLAAFFYSNGLGHFFMSTDEMEKQFIIYKNKQNGINRNLQSN